MNDIVVHIPHDGNDFPEDLFKSVLISRPEFEKYHKEISDRHISRLTDNLDCTIVKFSISRLLCDVERFLKDEVMEKYGMGFCYEKTHDGKVFKRIDDDVKAKTKKYYLEHHEKCDEIARSFANKKWLIVDLHSFHEEIIVDESKKGHLPDICIGYAEKFCDEKFLNYAVNFFRNRNYKVDRNYPYEGSFVPNIVYKGEITTQVSSIMIEINKSCYLDENFEIAPQKFGKLKADFEDFMKFQ